MTFKMVNKEFRLVGLRGSGEFDNFGNEVPFLAKQLLSRSNEISNSTETEIGLYEPKRDVEHRVGHYYVGLMVSEKLNKVPIGMEYIETNNSYITTKGNITSLGELHLSLLKWGEEQGFQRDFDSYIVETYHPIGEGEEEVEIYLPIKV